MENSLFNDQEHLLIRELSRINPRSLETWDLLENALLEYKEKLSPQARKVIQQKLTEAAVRLHRGMFRPCSCQAYLWLCNFIKKSFSLILLALLIASLAGLLHYYIYSSLQEAGYVATFFVSKKYINQQMSAVIFLYCAAAVVFCLAFVRGVLVGSRLTRKQIKKNCELRLYIQRISNIAV